MTPEPHTWDGFLSILGRRHVLPLLHAIAQGAPLRFSALQERLPDVAPSMLSRRLTEFAHWGLVRRRSYPESPPRVEYEATEKAKQVWPIFMDLYRWHVDHGGIPVACDSQSTA